MVLGLVFAALGAEAGVPERLDLNAQECGDGDWACLPLKGSVTVAGAGGSSRAAQGSPPLSFLPLPIKLLLELFESDLNLFYGWRRI